MTPNGIIFTLKLYTFLLFHFKLYIMKTKSKSVEMPIINALAAGIDIGGKENYVAINQNQKDVRVFGVYHEDHKNLAKWLTENGITIVALEATGTFWQTLYFHLESLGFEVLLVSSKTIKNPSGKTDKKDCLWLQKLLSLGLLNGSFIPEPSIEKIRQFTRYRNTLVEEKGACANRVQKYLHQLNIRLDIAFSDIMGVSSLTILNAILAGERDADVLADMIEGNVKKSKEEIKKALCGNWREDLLFLIGDQLAIYKNFDLSIEKVEKRIEAELASITENEYKAPIDKLTKKKLQKGQYKIDVATLSYNYYGVDLMEVDGIAHNTVMSIIGEVGRDIYKFKTAKQFSSWLRLAPNNKISGGKILSNRTPKSKNNLAIAFRNAANTVGQRKDGMLKSFFSRIAYRKGRGAAITATARKLAVIIWNMIMKKESYKPILEEEYNQRLRDNAIKRMKKTMDRLGIGTNELIMQGG